MNHLQLGVELEQKQLLATIANIERNMAVPASREVSNALLTYLGSLKNRLGILEEQQKQMEAEQRRSEGLQRVAVLVERETALSSAEKEQYRGFLEKEHFTKNDFDSLEQFYSHSWERLSEGGKDQMSHRVWEGVRREEYQFSELPESVKEKEAQRLRDSFRAGSRMHDDLTAIPEKDRSDFISAWDDGRKTESYRVLDRQSFAESVAISSAKVTANVVTGESVAVEEVKEGAKARTMHTEQPRSTPEVSGTAEFKAMDLSGISLTSTADVQPPLAGMRSPGSAALKRP